MSYPNYIPSTQLNPCVSDPLNYCQDQLLPPKFFPNYVPQPQVNPCGSGPLKFYQGQLLPNPQYYQNTSREFFPPYDNIPKPSIPVMNTTSPNSPAQDIHQPHIPHVPPGNTQPLPYVPAQDFPAWDTNS